MTKGEKGKRGREEKVEGTERRFLLLSLHTFNLLLPSALANSVHYRALSPPCSALPGCSRFDIESCLSLQSGGLRSHSLIVEEIFVPCLNLCTCACLPAQLSCCSLLLVEVWHFTIAQMDQIHGQETGPWCSMEVRQNLSKYINYLLKRGMLE